MKPLALILHASGSNRDQDVACALELAGAETRIVHVNALRSGEVQISDAQMLVLPGGFSYADALGAGKLMALDLQTYISDALKEFVESGKPVIGICNGFQALVKADVLPGWSDEPRAASLVYNDSGSFHCGWVTLQPEQNSVCVWTRDLTEPIQCPVAHGEGRFTVCDNAALDRLRSSGQIALTYVDDSNPNGSVANIAGISNAAGNVLGLMPHPENHVYFWQHPQHTRGITSGSGLALFQAGVRAVR
jgi:phosphoribosylformylglycinamidine synthase subunit PurQ / glutaminase